MKYDLKHLYFTVFTLCFILLTVFGKTVKQEVSNALSLCITSLIPSVYPFAVISAVLTSLSLPKGVKKAFAPLLRLLGLSENAAQVMLFGLLCGYPIGFKLSVYQYEKNLLSKEEARFAAMLSFSPGIAYAVFSVGDGIWNDIRFGVVLLTGVILSNLTVLLPFWVKKHPYRDKIRSTAAAEPLPLSKILTDSVDRANVTSLKMTAAMLCFAAVKAILFSIRFLPAKNLLACLLEVCAGQLAAKSANSVSLSAFGMGFGGLGIACQLTEELNVLELSFTRFLLTRLSVGAVTVLWQRLLSLPFSLERSVSAEGDRSFGFYRASLFQSLSLALFILLFMVNNSDSSAAVKDSLLKKQKRYGKIGSADNERV